jgi:hypothetical protein
MKTRKKIGLTTVILMAVAFYALLLACVTESLTSNPVNLASSLLRTDLPQGTTVITNVDTGPGLPIPGGASDGYSFLVLQIPPEKTTGFAGKLKSPLWKPLPLAPDLAKAERYLQPTIMSGVEGNIPIATSTGYYLFFDRQEEYNRTHSRQTYDTTRPFYERSSSNYTFGMFDDQSGKLYLWSIDT